MAQYRMKAPDGQVYQIEGPDGATDEQVRQEVIRQNPHLGGMTPGTAGPLAPPTVDLTQDMSTPKPGGYYGESTSPLISSKALLGVQLPKIPSPPLSLALPPAASLLGRAALQGAGAVGEKLLEGKTSPSELGGEALKGAGWSAGADMLLGPLGKFVGRQTGAKQATKAFEEATKAHEATKATKAFKEAHDVSMTKALNATETQAFERAMETAAQTGAADIAKDLVAKVPALKGTKVSGEGLYDALYGSGIGKVSTEFDRALGAVMEKGKGQIVQVPDQVVRDLNLTAAGGGSGLPANVQALFARGARIAKDQYAAQGVGRIEAPGTIGVDAAELAQKMTGQWGKYPQAYREAAKALDAADIGDPAARAAYKAYVGTGEFINKSKALDAKGNLDLDKLLKAFADLKSVKGLERRGIGHGTEGVLQDVARRGPLAPTPRQTPINQVPETPAPTPPDITAKQIPGWAKHWIGAGLGASVGALGGGVGAGLGGALGALLGHTVLPKELVTRGPIAPGVVRAAQALSGPLAVSGRKAQDFAE